MAAGNLWVPAPALGSSGPATAAAIHRRTNSPAPVAPSPIRFEQPGYWREVNLGEEEKAADPRFQTHRSASDSAHMQQAQSQSPCSGFITLVVVVLSALMVRYWITTFSASGREQTEFDYLPRSSEPVSLPTYQRASEPVSSHQPSDLSKECRMPGHQYLSSGVCSATIRNEWSRRASVPRQQKACEIDYHTGKMTCDTKVTCAGGTHSYINKVQTKHTIEYDCSQCHDIQRESCCGKCFEVKDMASKGKLRVNNSDMDEVLCRNCEQDVLRSIRSKHDVSCSHNGADGTFQCSLKEHCELGTPVINMENLSFECVSTPCDQCADSFAQAQCCVDCLEHVCSSSLSFVDRKICRGCAISQ